jgi:hypothetical protein
MKNYKKYRKFVKQKNIVIVTDVLPRNGSSLPSWETQIEREMDGWMKDENLRT